MKLTFLKNFNGSDDGVNLKRFKTGGTYTVPSDLTPELAKVAIDNKYAVREPEPFFVQREVPTVEEDVEILYEDMIEDEPEEEAEAIIKKVEKATSKKFAKSNKGKKK